MRNLKKFLALVLAMMMTFSLMVTVNAATPSFSEDAEPKFQEAIDVLTGLGVIKGVDNGDGNLIFRGERPITRAEAAAIVYRLYTGDVKEERTKVWVGYANFDDVSSDAWYAGVVGYCASNGLIQGDGTNFAPHKNVTGYEMLAMLLRAVGYDRNDEFTGSSWQTNVSYYTTINNILVNVNNSSYKGRSLTLDATREMVAEIAFQAAVNTPTVIYTPLGGYSQTTTVLGGDLNPSLAEKWFGLAKITGIIVGNQATGETKTLLGVGVTNISSGTGASDPVTNARLNNSGSYLYTKSGDVNVGSVMPAAGNVTLKFNTKTGLEQFGHKVDVWYRYGSYGATTAAYGNSSFYDDFSTIYCVRDLSTRSAVVYSGDGTNGAKLKDGTTANPSLGDIAGDNGFTVSTKAQSGIYTSDGFDAIAAEYNADTDAGVAKDNGDSNAYLLISNSGTKGDKTNALDVIVALGVSVDKISAVNNYAKVKDVVTLGANGTDNNRGDDDVVIKRSVTKTVTDNLLVYGEDDIKVGQRVVLNKIKGTNRTANGFAECVITADFYGINALTKEKDGTITAISGDGTVTLAGGDTIKMSPLWNVTGGGKTGTTSGKGIRLIGATVTFVLDMNGDYVDCYVGGDITLAGAYAYWVQEGIDGFKYYLQGVTQEGEIVTREITKDTYNSQIANKAADNVEIYHMSSGTPDNTTGGSSVSIMAPGKSAANGINGYNVYTINGANEVTEVADADQKDAGWTKIPNAASSWKSDDKSFVDTETYYFSSDTKFHVVTGWGSTLKVTEYVGLDALLDGANSVEVAGWYFTGKDDTEHVDSKNNIVEEAVLVDVSRIQPNTFLYSKDDPDGNDDGQTVDKKAHQFQLYVAGEDKTSGILVADNTYPANTGTAWGSTDGADANTFYTYTKTTEGYYVLTADAMDGTEYGIKQATPVNASTAFGDIKLSTKVDGRDLFHAADAKVIDISGTDHGITDYASLRRAIEENATNIKLDILLTSKGGDTASVIYVTAVDAAP